MDILQMMSAFRQLRPTTNAEASNAEASSEGENRDDADSAASVEVEMEECDRTSLCKIEALMDEKMRVLEHRMQSYVNAKVAEMMKQIEIRLEQRELVTLQQVKRMTHTQHNDNELDFEEQLD